MRWKNTRPEPRPETYWKQWFAWHPVVIEDTKETVWLEWIWRHTDNYRGGVGESIAEHRYRSDVHPQGANLEYRDR